MSEVLIERAVPGPDDHKVLAVDFDGTLVESCQFPEIGKAIPGALDTLKRLMSEGWAVVIHSHRAVHPEGTAQIVSWLEANSLPGIKVFPKIKAHWYVDDRAIGISDGWNGVYERLHTPEAGAPTRRPEILASAVRFGRFGMREITDALGVDYDEFRSDVQSAHCANTPEERWVVANAFRVKYGMRVDVTELAKSAYPDDYWREVLANVLERRQANAVVPGDDVLLTSGGVNFGRTGSVLEIDTAGVLVALDGVGNTTTRVVHADTEILSGLERLSLRRIGSRNAPLASWYTAHGNDIYRQLRGKMVTSHLVAGRYRVCSSHGKSGDFAKDVNTTNLDAVYMDVSGNLTPVFALRLCANSPQLLNETVVQLEESIRAHDKLVAGVNVIAANSTDMFMLLEYGNAWDRQYLQTETAKLVSRSAEDNGFLSALKSGALRITCGVDYIPAPYSVDTATGNVYQKYAAGEISGFKETFAKVV